jgi:excisionase family DNA binding protein
MQEATVTSPNMMQGMSVNAYAGCLAISPRQVYRLIEQGEVKAYRIGRAVRIPTTEVERFITSHMEVR